MGITVPILPGVMPIMTYGGFKRMTAFCKTYVPPHVADVLETIKDNDEAVKVGAGVARAAGEAVGAGVVAAVDGWWAQQWALGWGSRWVQGWARLGVWVLGWGWRRGGEVNNHLRGLHLVGCSAPGDSRRGVAVARCWEAGRHDTALH